MIQTIYEAATAIRNGSMTPIGLVEQCLANIDRWEPRVHAWVFVDRDEALAEARRLTEELQRGQDRGPLHGIPIGIKDIFDVFDWPTAAGSKRWAKSYARQDAVAVWRLREAGAVFLGKTVTTQYASFDPPVTRNPWDLERTPGGSSSGSAVAVACGMCLGALGSQTGGSIIRPASYCGVAGLKPTYGVCSCDGVVPLADSMDHPGPMAACVADLAIQFQAIVDPGALSLPDWSELVEPSKNASFLRLGRLFHDLADPGVRDAIDKSCDVLRAKGGRIDNSGMPASFADVLARHRTVMAVEAAKFHRKRLERHPEEYEPNITKLLTEGLHCPAPEYASCKEHQRRLGEEMATVLADGRIAITPATTSPAPPRDTTGDPAFNSPWSYLGLPTISLPTGQFIDGLPISIQLIAGKGQEPSLFRVAAWVEAALGVKPLEPTLEVRT